MYVFEVPVALDAEGPPIVRPERNGAVASSRVERFPVGEKINWQIGEMVGAGAFGRVYLGLNNDTGQLMAVKQVKLLNASCRFALGLSFAQQRRIACNVAMLISSHTRVPSKHLHILAT